MSQALLTSRTLVLRRPSVLGQLYSLTKPRVLQLSVFCALIGMLLAASRFPPRRSTAAALAGIWLVAAAAAVLNCLVDRRTDARMARTAWRPTTRGQLGSGQVLAFAVLLCICGCALLYFAVNALTMAPTVAAFVSYAIVYTVVLSR